MSDPLAGNLRQIFLDLLRVVQPSGVIPESRGVLAEILGISERTLRHNIGRLEEAGVISERSNHHIRIRFPRQAYLMDFSELNLEGIDASGSDLTQATFAGSNLRNADLHGATISNTAFNRACLEGTNLEGLRNSFRANFSMANLQGALLNNGQLAWSAFGGTNLMEAEFRNAILTHVQLTNADCRGADFTNADLTGADLTGSDLRTARLSGVKWLGATLKGTQMDDEAFASAARAGTRIG